MNSIKLFGTITIMYFKGLLVIGFLWLLPAVGIFIFDSCKKANYDNSKSGEAAKKFKRALDAARTPIAAITLRSNKYQRRFAQSSGDYYLDFPVQTELTVIEEFSSDVTLQSLANVLINYGVLIDDSVNVNTDLIINVPEQAIKEMLQPLVVESKNYLFSKGITSQQIVEMLQEESAEEIDLIPFVKVLTGIEQGQYTARNFSFPFISSANALPRFVECGLHALGADAFFALAQSTAKTWTWSAMKTAFKSVAKRMLGPIGVAIAVIDFGYCMLSSPGFIVRGPANPLPPLPSQYDKDLIDKSTFGNMTPPTNP